MAIDPIVVRFATAGIPEVKSAFATVAEQAVRFENKMVAASEKGASSRVKTANKEAAEKEKALLKAKNDAEKAEREATRLKEREAKRRQDIVRKSSEMAGRDAVRAAREDERIEEQKTRAVEREEARKARIRIRSSEMAGRAAAREAAEEIAAREKALRSTGQKWRGRLSGAATMIGATVGIGGAFAVADAARKEMSDERNAAQLVNLVTSGTQVPEGANVQNILAQAGAVSKATGLSRGDIVEASKTYAKNAQHGDFKGVMGNMAIFAKLARVTGADMSEIAEAAGTLQSQNPDLTPDAMKQLLLDANEMSKQGKMSFSESLAQMGKVGSTRSSYAGNVAENQRTLIGYAQLAKSGGTAEEVGTFVSALAMESTEANKKFRKKHRKNLFETDTFGRIANPGTLVEDVLRNTGGNIQEINELMGRRGGALFREVEQSYIQGAGKKNDVEAGIRSVRAYMGEVTGARGTEAGLDAQFKQSMDAPGEKFANALNRVEESLMERFAPALAKVADKLSDPNFEKNVDGAISALGSLAEFLVDLGPFKGVAAILGARVAADVTQAQIGNGLKSVLTRVIQGSLSDKMLAGLNIATASLIVGSLLTGKGSDQTDRATGPAAMDAEAIRAGVANPDDPVIKQHRAELEKRKAELEEGLAHPKGPLGETVAKIASKPFELLGLDPFKNQLDKVTKALQELDDAAKKAKPAVQGVQPVTSGAPAHPIGSAARSG